MKNIKPGVKVEGEKTDVNFEMLIKTVLTAYVNTFTTVSFDLIYLK